MAPKKAVNPANLEALGAKRLAEILLELGTQEAAIKRRLRLELSAEVGAEAVAAEIGELPRWTLDWTGQGRPRKVLWRPTAAAA